MKVHPREFLLNKAETRFALMLRDFQKDLGLTDVEMLIVLTERINNGYLRYFLRHEWYPERYSEDGGDDA